MYQNKLQKIMKTYHSGLFTAFEDNLKRRRCIDNMLDKFYVLQHKERQ